MKVNNMKNVIILLTIVLSISACGRKKVVHERVPCSSVRYADHVETACENGTIFVVYDGQDGAAGATGSNGLNGANGSNGHSVVYNTTTSTSCANGGTTILMASDVNDNLILDLGDSNINSVTICNGLNGANGTNGTNAPPTPYSPTAIVNPCGDHPSIHDEVYLKLQNGTVLASFSDNVNGLNTRFAQLTAGTYNTTDGDNCTFTINASGDITYENHHY